MSVALLVLIPYAVALLLFVFEATGRLGRGLRTPSAGRGAVPIGLLLVTFAVQLAATWYAATHGEHYGAWRAQLPLPVMDLGAAHAGILEATMLACGAVQSYALIVLYRACPPAGLAIGGACAFLALSLAAPALSSADLYSNAGYSLLANAYATPAHGFGLGYAPIDRWWGTPLVPSPYGPLWNVIDRLATAAAPGLLGKMLALRVACALAFAGLILTMHRLGLPPRILAVTALNPAFFMQFVVNAHNDVVMLLVVALAALALRRSAWLGAALLVAAGLLKLPYALLSLPVLGAIGDRRLRWVLAALVPAAVAGLSWWWGGPLYAAALEIHARTAPHGFRDWRIAAAAVALVLLIAALAGARRVRTGVWLIPPMGALYPAFVYPWYLMWSFPYALGRRRVLGYVLVWFPFASALVNQHLLQVWTLVLVYPLVALFATTRSLKLIWFPKGS